MVPSATAGTRSPLEARLEGPGSAGCFLPLFDVRISHDYYNTTGGECPDFRVIPTPDSAQSMARLGLIFRDKGTGFAVYVQTSRVPELIAFVNDRGIRSGGDGLWTWLSFLLVPTNPDFNGFTRLPMSASPASRNFHASNLDTSIHGGMRVLGAKRAIGAELFVPVTGSTLATGSPTGATVTLADFSGTPVFAPQISGAAGTSFNLGALPYGYYTVDTAGRTAPGSAEPSQVALLVPQSPQTLGLIDLLLMQPPGTIGDPDAFPVAGGAATVSAVQLVLPFAARETVWKYYVVSQSGPATFSADLQISGPGASFVKSAEVLPNGDTATLFTADRPLALSQKSKFHFMLSGKRQASRGPGTIVVARLPVAPASPVFPGEGDEPLAGISKIYVYV